MELSTSGDCRARTAWLLALLVLLGLFLRLFRLGAQSLWNDEIITWNSVNGSPLWVLTQTAENSNMPPLYFLATHFFLGLMPWLGMEAALRLPSALAGAFSIPLLYAVGRRLVGERASLLAAAWLCLSPFHVWYSQEARPYSVLILLSLGTLWCMFRGLEEPERHRFKLGFAVLGAMAFACHIIVIPLFGAAALFLFLEARRRPALFSQWKNWALSFALLGLLCVPSLLRLRQLGHGPAAAAEGREPFSLVQTAYALVTFADGFSIGPSVAELHEPDRLRRILHAFPLLAPSWLAVALAALFGAASLWREKRTELLDLLVWLAAPFVFVIIGAIVSPHPFNVRYVMLACAPFWLLVAAGVEAAKPRLLRLGLIAVLLGTSVFALANLAFEPRYAKEDYRAAAAALQGQAGAHVLVYRPFTARNLRLYDPELRVSPFPLSPEPKGPDELRARIEQVTAGEARIWLLLNRGTSEEYAAMLGAFDRDFQRGAERDFAGIRLVEYLRAGPVSKVGVQR